MKSVTYRLTLYSHSSSWNYMYNVMHLVHVYNNVYFWCGCRKMTSGTCNGPSQFFGERYYTYMFMYIRMWHTQRISCQLRMVVVFCSILRKRFCRIRTPGRAWLEGRKVYKLTTCQPNKHWELRMYIACVFVPADFMKTLMLMEATLTAENEVS